MNDRGGKENEKETDHNNNITRKSTTTENSNKDFAFSAAKVAVAQVCESEGFQSFQQSALEAFADVVIRYIRELGKTSNLYANLAGRSECNVLDVIQGLEDLGLIQGFPGASDVHHPLANSGTIKEISQFVSLMEEIPFYSLPRFPVCKVHKPPLSFCQMDEEPPGEHIPMWLPAFPRPQSHVDLPVCNGQEQDRLGKVEPPLMNMQEGLIGNDGFQEVFGLIPVESSKIMKPAEMNPFLTPPFMYGEREIATVEFPARVSEGEFELDNANVMDLFDPSVEAAKSKLPETEESKIIRSDGRPIVRLKFRSVRKSLPATSNIVIAEDSSDEKLANCLEGDVDKDGKNRRAEKILKEAVESPLDPGQL